MSQVVFELFPAGRRKALTISCDDGRIHDRKLVAILNHYGLRGTFHLNSGSLGQKGFLSPKEIARLFKGHEVATHSVTHPHLPHLSREGLAREILDDRRNLEALVGYPVRGHAYPGGGHDDRVARALPTLGIAYARTCETPASFLLTDDFFRWGPNAAFSQDLIGTGKRFLELPPTWATQHLLVYGHSRDFEEQNSWKTFEAFCSMMGAAKGIWQATAIEVVDYMDAVRRMRCSADGSILHNPSAISVWATINGQSVKIGPGQTIRTKNVGRRPPG